MRELRQDVKRLLTPKLGEANTLGPGRGNKTDVAHNGFNKSNDTTYIQARLKRDHTDMRMSIRQRRGEW